MTRLFVTNIVLFRKLQPDVVLHCVTSDNVTMTTGVLGLTDVPSGSAAHSMRSGRAAERLKVGVFTAKQRAMARGKTSGSCSRFQANIFNRNKCQNCFKARELHLQNELEMERAKPVYGGWLCLAPEGTDFENPVQRSRKWQRRFFILFENGGLSFALDELPGTLPQGAVDMLTCTDVCDAEPRTGQKNSLCIATPEREVFIRADSREIINGWSEQLCVFLRTNKQNLKKKRKVEPVANQEPSPAKVAATGASFPGSDRDAAHRRGPDPTPAWTEPPGPEWTPAGTSSSFLDPLGADRSPNRPADQQSRRDASSERPDGTRTGQEGGAAVCRQGRAETRPAKREKLPSCGDTAQLRAPPPQRRAKSLDRRTSDTVMTATCERGLALMEECHLKVLEELQCLHQLEVERLLMEGGRLLEEESVATATAIEAIERAHRQELQELQQKSEWERRDPPLEDAYRQHREELASCQRELGVLSQQFSMKCLENRHLIQALDAERKALSQCQQENQHLQSRNQELSGHLAGEITRLCSLAKPESLPPSRETDVYEMEVTLRVKDSEVCYLKREITSLKDKLLSTLKDASYKAAAATFTENY
uniref:PH domain-containing protein n=1 Tax=Oryzias latipes TaxID=8090 RepID=A0A3P9KXP1_ORYLA